MILIQLQFLGGNESLNIPLAQGSLRILSGCCVTRRLWDIRVKSTTTCLVSPRQPCTCCHMYSDVDAIHYAITEGGMKHRVHEVKQVSAACSISIAQGGHRHDGNRGSVYVSLWSGGQEDHCANIEFQMFLRNTDPPTRSDHRDLSLRF